MFGGQSSIARRYAFCQRGITKPIMNLSTSLQPPQRPILGKNILSSSSSLTRRLSTMMQRPMTASMQRKQLSRSQRTLKLRRNESTVKPATEQVPEPTYQELKLVALGQAIPFIGFGFMDNSILIVAGDAIDTSLGIWLGISTLCAAAIGNIISDLAGIGLGSAIEDFCAKVLKLPVPDISAAQRQLRSVRTASNLGMAVGMTFGCVVGMFPLLFIDSTKVEQMKKRAHLEALFQDVVTEAKTLIGAESTCLYLRVHLDDEPHGRRGGVAQHSPPKEGVNPGQSGKYLFAATPQEATRMRPAVDGDHLYAMHYVVPDRSKVGEETHSPRFVRLGKGLVSRAILTGEAWNISNVHAEPDFLPDYYEADGSIPLYFQHIVVVPVFDAQGQAIAVLRALNKLPAGSSSLTSLGPRGSSSTKNKTTTTTTRTAPTPTTTSTSGFSDADVQILKSLASHISVSLQSVFRDEQDEEMRLRDTIRILKEHGLEGIADETYASSSSSSTITSRPTYGMTGFQRRDHRRPSLFPTSTN